MRVALFSNLIDPKWLSLSMERYSFELKKGLDKLGKSDLEVINFQPHIPKPLTLIPTYWRYYISRYYYYPYFAQRNEGQVNHIIDHSFAQVSKFLNKDKTLITCHDLIPLKTLNNGEVVEKDLKARELFLKSVNYLNEVRFVIADSEATKKDLQNILGVDSEKIKVIYLGKNVGLKPDMEALEIKKKLNLPNNGPLLLHVGHNLTYKNIENIFNALAIVKDKMSFIFAKVGPDFTNEQKDLIQRLNLKDYIIETGFLSEKDLINLYHAADLLVYPSLFEGFGLPVLEAMSVGLIPVVSKGTSLEEITGDLGILVEPTLPESIAEGILRGLSLKTAETIKLKELVKEQASKFSWEQTANQTYALYEEING